MDFYRRLRARGLDYGPEFRVVGGLRRGPGRASGRVEGAPDAGDAQRCHPVLLDGALQVLAAALPDGPDMYLPFGLERLDLRLPLEAPFRAAAELRPEAGNGTLVGDVRLADATGRPIGEIRGVVLRRAAHGGGASAAWLHRLDWEAAVAAPPQPKGVSAAGTWLLFADAEGVAAPLVHQLESAGGSAIVVERGARAERVGERRFVIDPARRDDFRALLGAVLGSGAPACRGVVYLWSAGTGVAESAEAAELGAAVEADCRGALGLVQALAALETAEPPRLWLVTRGAQPAGPVASLALAGAPLWGFARSVALEHPELRPALVDLDPTDPEGSVRLLLDELLSPSGETQLAFREGRRLGARLVPAPERLPGSPVRLRRDGAYLVTGGLGGLGFEVARWLVEHGAGRVVLAGRSAGSPEARARAAALERAGRIVVARADVSAGADVRGLVASMPDLRGVVHAAGTLADGVVTQLEWTAFADVMAAKVAGAWNLHAHTRGRELDFFVLFSSAAALLGSPGQSNYAAANAFLDALAHHRRALGLTAHALDWGPWEGAGMAGATGAASLRRWADLGMGRIPPGGGLAVLERALGAAGAQTAVLPVDWTRYFAQWATAPPPMFGRLAEASPRAREVVVDDVAARLRASPPARRPELFLDFVLTEIRRVLALEATAGIDPAQPLPELGLDSLMAVEVRNRVRTLVGVSVPVVKFLDGTGAGGLAAHVFQQWTIASLRPRGESGGPPGESGTRRIELEL